MLQQKLQQKTLQKLSPQQIQLIKLLEIPTMQLEERIKKELEENPALEEGEEEDDEPIVDADDEPEEGDDGDDLNEDSLGDEELPEKEVNTDQDEFSLEDYIDDDDTPSYKLSVNNYSPDSNDREEIPFSVGSTFHEFLESQVGIQFVDEKKQILAKYIIGNIDEDGYLRREISAMVDDIAFSQNIETTEAELAEVLDMIQHFDPPGIAARDLRECLLLQIKRKDTNLPEIKTAEAILSNFFEEFTKKHYDKICKRLNIIENDLKNAVDEVLRLNPKPGSSFSDPHNKANQHIIPDFFLESTETELQITLNARNVPELRISKTYANMLQDYSYHKDKPSKEQKDAVSFVKQKLDSAKWFIDAIRQRQNTLMQTMNTIINYQKEYFIDGDETKLKPMILKDIADITGLDISTISRVANSKYIQTHFGIFPLKFFFSEAMHTDTGEEVSSREIKKILQECIESENKKRPLTDDKLAKILQQKGYQIARRTVAKYREQLGIAVGRLRKEL